MTLAERCAARRKNLKDHIRLLEERYSESERRGSVQLLEKRLFQIPSEKDDFEAKPKIKKKI